MSAILEVRTVSKRFGGLKALDEVSFSLDPGRIHALIGPNGAGKSTVLNIICGFTQPSSGQVLFQGKNVTGRSPHRMARLGVARTFQTPALYPQMTVFEHVLLALVQTKNPGKSAPMPSVDDKAGVLKQETFDILGLIGLAERASLEAKQLPYGQRRLLEIAQGLARRPQLLLLDEPAAGLNDVEVETLQPLLRQIAAQGIAVLLIEHNIPLVMSVASWVVVLNFGQTIFAGEPDAALQDKAVLGAYLGREREASDPVS